jgi:hypothetical protein
MQTGRVLVVDTPRGIVEKYQRLLLAVTSDNMYRLICDLREWEKTDTAYAFGQYLHFTSKNDDVEATELEHFLLARKHRQLQVMEIAPGIEDMFMDLMSRNQL